MKIPLNGRVAIIEDHIDEAMPLMKLFAINQVPYVFYKGSDSSFLPEDNSRYNDIRLLFLDLNLIDKSRPSFKQVKSVLYGVLKKVLSDKNYPYSIILWSKQQNDYSAALDELFQNELKDRAPVSINKFLKSDFFSLNGDSIDNDLNLLSEVEKIIESDHGHDNLLNWENKVHLSTDAILQKLFFKAKEDNEWENSMIYNNNDLTFELIFDLLEKGQKNEYNGVTETLKDSLTTHKQEIKGQIIGKDAKSVLVKCIVGVGHNKFENRKFELSLFAGVTNCDEDEFVNIEINNELGFRSIRISKINENLSSLFIEENTIDFSSYSKPK